MRLATYTVGFETRLGFIFENRIFDLKQLYSKYLDGGLESIFSGMKQFLSAGETSLNLAKRIVQITEENGLESRNNDSLPLEEVRLRAPVTDPGKVLLPAVNYLTHEKETTIKVPTEPYFFTKFNNAIIGNNDQIILPLVSKQMDYEGELAVVIGKKGKYISEKDAYDYVAGYMILNDISSKDLQHPPGWPEKISPFGQNWVLGKGLDTACPIGPFLVTKDEIPTPYPLRLTLKVNGELRQDSTTDNMIFKIPQLLAYISRGITLMPGDIVSTGTPGGVGWTRGLFLKDGDVIEVEIEKIGTLRNTVVREG